MTLTGKKVVITGATGMLATDLRAPLAAAGAEVVLTDVRIPEEGGPKIEYLNITNGKEVSEALAEIQPDWVLNCAAYTMVDAAEDNQEAAFAVNATGPGNLAHAVRDCGAQMLHISTDYVFGGHSVADSDQKPYKESDVPCPCGIYGHSKRHGDELVERNLPNSHLIVRTSWLHGVHGPNFVQTMLRLGEENDELRVVNDQIGSPTWTGWLADTILRLMERDARGVFHATSLGNISWYDFAKEIFSVAGIEVELLPQSTEELGRRAPRPAYSTLDVSKLEAFMGTQCITWQECVREHLQALGKCR